MSDKQVMTAGELELLQIPFSQLSPEDRRMADFVRIKQAEINWAENAEYRRAEQDKWEDAMGLTEDNGDGEIE